MTASINTFRFILSKMWQGKGFVRNVTVMGGSTVLGQAIIVLASPILTRLYTPPALGTLAIFMSIALILSAVGSWHYEYAIMLPDSDKDAAHILTLSSLIAVLISSLILVGVGFFRHQLAHLLGVAELTQWLWLIPLILLLKGLFQVGNYWYARKKQFVRLAVAGVSRSIVTMGTQIGAALLTSIGTAGLIIGVVAGETVATSILSADIKKNCQRLLPDSRFWASVRGHIYKYKNFPLYTAPYSFVGVCAKRSLFLLLSVYATTYEVGLFAIATRFTRLPAGLISAAIKPVFFQKAATELGSPNLERLVIQILTFEMLVATPILVLFLFNAQWICGVVFGDAWIAAGTYATWLALPAFMLLFATWPDRIYDVSGRQRLALSMEVVYDILSIALFGLSLAWLKSVEWAVGLYSGASAIYYVIWLTVTFRVAKFSMRGLWRIGAVFACMMSIMGTVHWITVILFPRAGAVSIYMGLIGGYYVYLAFKFRKEGGTLFREDVSKMATLS